MKIIKKALIFLSLTMLWIGLVEAATSQLQNISINDASNNKTEIHLNFSQPVKVPKGFVLQDPPRIVFDFPGVAVAPNARSNNTRRGLVRSVRAAGNKGQTRLVVSLNQFVDYTIENRGGDVVMLFDAPSPAVC